MKILRKRPRRQSRRRSHRKNPETLVLGALNPSHRKASRRSRRTNPSRVFTKARRHRVTVYGAKGGQVFAPASKRRFLSPGTRINPRRARRHNPGLLGISGKGVMDGAIDVLVAVGGMVITKVGGRKLSELAGKFNIPYLSKPIVGQAIVAGIVTLVPVKIPRKNIFAIGCWIGVAHSGLSQLLPATGMINSSMLADIGEDLPPMNVNGYIEQFGNKAPGSPIMVNTDQGMIQGYITSVSGVGEHEIAMVRMPNGEMAEVALNGYATDASETDGDDNPADARPAQMNTDW